MDPNKWYNTVDDSFQRLWESGATRKDRLTYKDRRLNLEPLVFALQKWLLALDETTIQSVPQTASDVNVMKDAMDELLRGMKRDDAFDTHAVLMEKQSISRKIQLLENMLGVVNNSENPANGVIGPLSLTPRRRFRKTLAKDGDAENVLVLIRLMKQLFELQIKKMSVSDAAAYEGKRAIVYALGPHATDRESQNVVNIIDEMMRANANAFREKHALDMKNIRIKADLLEEAVKSKINK